MLNSEYYTWRCKTCFNHEPSKKKSICSLVKRNIKHLKICPADNIIYFVNYA